MAKACNIEKSWVGILALKKHLQRRHAPGPTIIIFGMATVYEVDRQTLVRYLG
jgi:hypothetical protein